MMIVLFYIYKFLKQNSTVLYYHYSGDGEV